GHDASPNPGPVARLRLREVTPYPALAEVAARPRQFLSRAPGRFRGEVRPSDSCHAYHMVVVGPSPALTRALLWLGAAGAHGACSEPSIRRVASVGGSLGERCLAYAHGVRTGCLRLRCRVASGRRHERAPSRLRAFASGGQPLLVVRLVDALVDLGLRQQEREAAGADRLLGDDAFPDVGTFRDVVHHLEERLLDD